MKSEMVLTKTLVKNWNVPENVFHTYLRLEQTYRSLLNLMSQCLNVKHQTLSMPSLIKPVLL